MTEKKFVSKAWWEPTPANIKEAAEILKIPACDRPKLNRHKDETDQELYERYLKEMTNYEPCVFCNGPRIRKMLTPPRSLKWEGRIQHWPAEYSIPKCVRFSIHNALDFLETDEEIERTLGKPCKHGYYTSECHECATFHLDHEKKPKF